MIMKYFNFQRGVGVEDILKGDCIAAKFDFIIGRLDYA